MSEQQWLIRVNGSEQMRVDDGETVLIGRKPLRPMASVSGALRLDIVDRTKSMSKVHARLTVHDNGAATIADLGSTNGTWSVHADGSLHRIPEQTEFVLSDSTMRFQFGDVPVDFIRVESEIAEPVADLFSYAGAQARADQQTPNLSVDDILDIRAGEPTGLLNTTKVRNSIAALHDGAIQDLATQKAAAAGQTAHTNTADTYLNTVNTANTHTNTADTYSDIHSDSRGESASQGNAHISARTNAESASHGNAYASAGSSADGDNAESLPLTPQAIQDNSATDSRDLFADAAAIQQAQQITDLPDNEFKQHNDAAAQEAEHTAHYGVQSVAQGATHTEANVGAGANINGTNANGTMSATNSSGANSGAANANDTNISSTAGVSGANTNGVSGVSATNAINAAGVSDNAYETGYQPVYAPGSVLDRLAKQDAAQDAGIEVDGYSSKDAMTVTDYAIQFEIAQRPQLVPYLAMNPALYDDLYAWLEAQGNADIDRALQANKGYNTYRNSGK